MKITYVQNKHINTHIDLNINIVIGSAETAAGLFGLRRWLEALTCVVHAWFSAGFRKELRRTVEENIENITREVQKLALLPPKWEPGPLK